jgi:hypothetical protein
LTNKVKNIGIDTTVTDVISVRDASCIVEADRGVDIPVAVEANMESPKN